MKNKGLVATIIIMSGVIVMLVVILLLIKMPSILLVKNLKDNFNDIVGKITDTTTEAKKVIKETEEEIVEVQPMVTTRLQSYSDYNDNVYIEYPEITGMDDEKLQERINYKIKANATSIISIYPVSTSSQKLIVYADVKSLDEDYITILYTGTITKSKTVASTTNKSSSGSKSSTSSGKSKKSSNKSVDNDPYLNGFVDPLAGMGNIGNNQQQFTNQNSMPLPTNDGVQVWINEATPRNNNDIKRQSNGLSTSDSGPTVKNITAPTAASKRTFSDNNVATNNPNGAMYSETNNNNYSSNNAPNNFNIVPNSNVVGTGAPVYGYSSSSITEQQIFYSNTIDMKHCIDVSLKDYISDYDALAKYIRSSNVEFVNMDEDMLESAKACMKKVTLSTLTKELKDADFRNEGLKSWPMHFSYKDEEGNICCSVRLTNKLGDYAIVKYHK